MMLTNASQLLAFFTPFITKSIQFKYGYVFAGCNLVAIAIVYFFVIEGQGRTLEEIDTMYLEKVTPWKSSKWVAPSAEEMARRRREAGTDLVDDERENIAGRSSDGALSGDTHAADGVLSKDEPQGTAHKENV